MINKFFDAQVSHSLVGHQRLYFQDYYYNTNKNICKYESSIPSSTTMIFNGQAVKMARWCRKFTVTGQYYYSFTPETDRGYFYVVNLFKTSTSPVKIQFNDDTFYFPVRGFTKAWNSAGGNAI